MCGSVRITRAVDARHTQRGCISRLARPSERRDLWALTRAPSIRRHYHRSANPWPGFCSGRAGYSLYRADDPAPGTWFTSHARSRESPRKRAKPASARSSRRPGTWSC